jgi:hypothetical protein
MNTTKAATLDGAVADLARRGFTEHFTVVDTRLHAESSGETFGPLDVIIRDYVRFEGVSDPSDMSIVYAIETRRGTRGILVDAFGVYSNPAISAFLKDVAIERGTAGG